MFFRKKKQELEFQRSLELSFRNVRQDIFNVFSWLNYLNERIISLKKEVDYIPKSKEEIKSIIDSYYSYDSLMQKIEMLTSKQKALVEELDSLRNKSKDMATLDDIHSLKFKTGTETESQKLDEISERLKNLEAHRQRNLREKVVQKITRNSKEYVKNIIRSLIVKYQKMPALKIKEMVVDEQGLCSKSSFYRLLAEIEQQNEIGVLQQGKEKIYFLNIKKNI